MHYPVDAEKLQRLLPAGLLVDTHQGPAYVGVVAISELGISPAVPLAPFLLLAAALLLGAVEMEQVKKFSSCVASCDCARSYAIGGAAVWLLAIQAAAKSGPKAPPKDVPVAPPVPPIATTAAGKAAKAA